MSAPTGSLLDQVRTQAETARVVPGVAMAFRDRIAASKIVQRGLLTRWRAHPEEAPTEPPDLRQIRERLVPDRSPTAERVVPRRTYP